MKKCVLGGKHASGIRQGGTVILALKRGGRGVIRGGVIRGIDESIQEEGHAYVKEEKKRAIIKNR